ncbi:hypothetical protein ATO2_00700 [Roseovarius sp. 22II1-1F6A]|nr:hypothetical protein ATO2_00700 [Roseovarius sp. 22II1-1F6A]
MGAPLWFGGWCTGSLPVGWRCYSGTACFMVQPASPLRSQREVAKRQPVGAGRRSPARPLALFESGCAKFGGWPDEF